MGDDLLAQSAAVLARFTPVGRVVEIAPADDPLAAAVAAALTERWEQVTSQLDGEPTASLTWRLDRNDLVTSLSSVVDSQGIVQSLIAATVRVGAAVVDGASGRLAGPQEFRRAVAACGSTAGIAVIAIDGIEREAGPVAAAMRTAQVGSAVAACLRDRDLAATLDRGRIGVLFAAAPSGSHVRQVLERIRASIAPVRVSIGVALGIGEAEGLRSLDAASAASGRAAQAGGDTWAIAGEPTAERRRVGELAEAIERGELTLVFQPLIDLSTGRVRGAEALVRWAHPHDGVLDPADFVALAEESGLVTKLTAAVLKLAIDHLAAWSDLLPEEFHLGVNVSAADLVADDLVDRIESWTAERGVEPRRLRIEVTETAALADVGAAARRLERIRALGASVALDDFGTGYAGLSLVAELPVDVVKIDRSFVDRLDDPHEAAVVRLIMRLAHELGLGVTAEGVSTDAQASALLGLGCDVAQGYRWGMAVPADRFAAEFLAPPSPSA